MTKVVLKVELQDDRIKKKVMKAVSSLSVWVDTKDQKLTLIGDIDPAVVVDKLRELCHTDILSFGPAKEKNKDEKNKAENKNDDQNQNLPDIVEVYEMRQPHYYYSSVEENRKVHDCWCGGGDPELHSVHYFKTKVVLSVELHDDKIKKKAMKVVSNLSGVESVSVDMKEQKLTLIGDIDPVAAVGKLRKLCHTDIVSVGPAKEESKGKNNKEESKGKNNKEEKKKPAVAENQNHQNLDDMVKVYEAYHHMHNQMRQPHYYYMSVEENPNACVIC